MDDSALRISLHEHDVLHREALQFHTQLQRVTQFTLLVTLAAIPIVVSRPQGDSPSSVVDLSLALLLIGGVYLVLSVVFVAYFRALFVNQSYRRKLEVRINALGGRATESTMRGSNPDEAPMGYSSFIAYWYKPGSASDRLLGFSWGIQFVFPFLLGVGCLAFVVAREGWSVFDPRAAVGVLFWIDLIVLAVAGFSSRAFIWFGRVRQHLEDTQTVVSPSALAAATKDREKAADAALASESPVETAPETSKTSPEPARGSQPPSHLT